jgi:hypothetical protein
MAQRQAFKANVELIFDNDKERIKIQNENISYIMIDSNYKENNLPIIYIMTAMSSDLYTKVDNYKESAKFYLSISKENVNSNLSISRDTLKDTFSYIISDSNPNYTEELDENTSSLNTSYKRVLLGLTPYSLINILRKSFNQVYNNIDQETLVSLALGNDKKTVVEKLTYNNSYDSLLVSPLSSRKKFLDFIFDKDPFYDTNFMYFIDFDKVYLLSKRGNPVDAEDGQLTSIIVDIRDITAEESYYEGMEVRNNAYYLYVNSVNSNVLLNKGSEKVANQLVAVDEDKDTTVTDININRTTEINTIQTFVRSENVSLLKNELETNSVIVEILKQNIDASIFTPNKEITVSNYTDYSQYDGKYIMIYKKEFYKPTGGGEFIISTTIGLQKLGNIVSVMSKSASNNKSSLATSTTSSKSTSLSSYSKKRSSSSRATTK